MDHGEKDHRRLVQVLQADPSLTAETPSGPLSRHSMQWFHRQQVTSYIHTLPFFPDILADPMRFEDMLLQADPPTRVVSQFYSLLLTASSPDLPPYTQSCEKYNYATQSL